APTPNRSIQPRLMIGVVRHRPVTRSTRQTCLPLRCAVVSAGWYSTPLAWSSTLDAEPGCSPAAPAMRFYWAIDGVCGPDAIFAPGAAKPTTRHPGPTTGQHAPKTEDPPVVGTTAGSNAGTTRCATRPDIGTPTDLTVPKSASSLTRPTPAQPDAAACRKSIGDRYSLVGQFKSATQSSSQLRTTGMSTRW
ncbi:MAG: hypothetical protein QOJ66_206, partial [Ilumatobacteraceae bacterium]